MPVVTKTESPVSSAAAHLHWNACRKQWAGRFLNNPADAASGTWLWTDGSGTNIRFGCLLCNRFFHEGHVTALPNIASKKYVHCEKEFCKASNFARHEQSALHRAAREHYYKVNPADFCVYGAPASKKFEIVWDSVIANGHSSAINGGFAEVGGSKKSRRLVEALAEALKQFSMNAARHAVSLSLMRDARAGKLMVRAVFVNSRGESHQCLVGIARQTGTTARCIADDTETLLTRFCTLRYGQREPKLSSKLRQRLRTYCHILTTDAAADELTAAELARLNLDTLAVTSAPFLPHLQFVLKDKSHAARRTERRDLDFPNIQFGQH